MLLPRPLARRTALALGAASQLALASLLALAACGNSSGTPAGSAAGGGNSGTALPPVTPPAATGTVPTPPAAGTSRAGTVYEIALTSPGTGDTVGITVFEPKTLVGGQRYPLVLQSHGYAGSRESSGSAVIQPLLDAGYGAISISERGSDNSTGTIRTMDPDFEGKNLLAILDWAESLPWVQFGTGVDGSTNNLVVGAMGGSYGGMFQYLINNIDPRHRLDAITPEIAPADLTYSLFPNSVLKAGWGTVLFGAGNTAGDQSKGNTDPFITNFFATALSTNKVSDAGREFFYYHSNAYFCNARDVVNNGTIGGSPGVAGTVIKAERKAVPPGKTNVLIFQGMRDTLFTFNSAYENFQCFKAAGGDVRLLSYQSGHNTLQVVPDAGNALYENVGAAQGSVNELDSRCGTLDVEVARMAFFEQYLKGVPGAADKVIPTKPCFSITKGDGVLVDNITTGKAGKEVAIPATNVVAGAQANIATAIPLNIPRLAGQVVAGIPFAELTVTKANASLPGEPILLLGLGRTRNGVPGVYDLIDNQLTPIRGTGSFAVDLVGVAERLGASDDLFLLVYGQHDQFHTTGTLNAGSPAVIPVSVAGKVWVPVLGNLAKLP